MIKSFRSTLVLMILLAASLPVIGFSALLVNKINTITSAAALRELDLRAQSIAAALSHDIDLLKFRLLTLTANRDVALATKQTTLGVRHFMSYRAMDYIREFLADNALVVSMYLIDNNAQVVDAAPAAVAPLPPAPVMADITAMLARTFTEQTARYVFVEFHESDFLSQTFALLSRDQAVPLDRAIQNAYGLAILVPLILDADNEVKGVLVGIVPVEKLAVRAFARVWHPNILTFAHDTRTILARSDGATHTLPADHIVQETPFVIPNSDHGQPLPYRLYLSEPASIRFAEVRATLSRLVLSILAAVLAVVVVAYLMARWLVAPLRTLQDIVQAYARGHYDLALPAMPFQEFQRFVTTLRDMGQQIVAQLTALRQSQAQLAEANRTLEQRVADQGARGHRCPPAYGGTKNL